MPLKALDIVEQLLNRREMVNYGNGDIRDEPDGLCEEAAIAIIQLRLQLDSLRKKLGGSQL